jgi:hypothetical protein
MQTVIDSGLYYIDSGFLSGFEAMSEMRELLDELYGSLPEVPDEEQIQQEGIKGRGHR